MGRVLPLLALAFAATPAAAAPRPLWAVGELSCGGRVSPAACEALTDRLVAELSAGGSREVIRQAELHRDRARCRGEPRCLEATRRAPARVVAGTVLPRPGGGYLIRLRLLDARTMVKRAEATATAGSATPGALGEALARAARGLGRGRRRVLKRRAGEEIAGSGNCPRWGAATSRRGFPPPRRASGSGWRPSRRCDLP